MPKITKNYEQTESISECHYSRAILSKLSKYCTCFPRCICWSVTSRYKLAASVPPSGGSSWADGILDRLKSIYERYSDLGISFLSMTHLGVACKIGRGPMLKIFITLVHFSFNEIQRYFPSACLYWLGCMRGMTPFCRVLAGTGRGAGLFNLPAFRTLPLKGLFRRHQSLKSHSIHHSASA